MYFLQWNCRSIKNKLIWFNIPPFTQTDIWIIQETFLKPNDKLQFPGKIIFRQDRLDRSGGGLLIAVPTSISAQQIPIQIPQSENYEALALKININNISFNIINLYASRGLNILSIKPFLESLSDPIFIFGDFNLHHPMWGSNHISQYSNEFVTWLTDSNFILLNHSVPTYRKNIGSSSLLDFTLCTSSLSGYSNTFVLESTYNSDHCPVITEFNFQCPQKRTIKKVDWTSVMKQSKFILHNIDENNLNLSDTVSKIISNNTRQIKLSNRIFPPWWNSTCHNFYKLKKYFRKKAIRDISPKLWIQYKRYSSRLRFHIKQAKKMYWDTVCNNVSNPRIFYNILKKFSIQRYPESNLNIFQVHNRFISHPKIQANLFADFFASINSSHEPLPLDFLTSDNSILNKPFHIAELNWAIKTAKNTTPGADHIPAKFLKRLTQNERITVLNFFQNLFDKSIVPQSWKHAIILPIAKPCKDKTKISSYRPIALTSVFAKTFERILSNRICHFLTNDQKLHPHHFGFVPFKDSRTATYLIHKAIIDAKSAKKYFVGISLDIKSAYDSVYIDGLIYKCLQIGITGKMALWIHEFLSCRSLQIQWRGCFSEKKFYLRESPKAAYYHLSYTLFI